MRLFYTIKLSSTILKENKFKLDLSFRDCVKSGLVVSLADSQMLKSIRDITGQVIDRDLLESWYDERNKLKKKKKTTIEEKKRIRELQDMIYNMMYIPQYITVTMDNIPDYEKMYREGFYFNHRWFKRISCSASQARVSTVVFCDCGDEKDVYEKEDSIRIQLRDRLDNGRDMFHPLAASKYNAYFGLYSSATHKVTKPRFCIIPDYTEVRSVDVDFVIEQGADEDDIIEPRTIDVEFDMVDGSGLISPSMAEQWGKDLEEDYTPCQFCIRCAFTKGALNEFDFVEWCKEENNENYFIKDIYGNMRDVREVDVILTEGMAKLWDSWDSQEHFEECCEKNGIIWGVTKYAPKADKEVNTANYQFLQTLNLDDEMIKDICQRTVDYIQGVSYDNIYYTLLFLMGDKLDGKSIESFLKQSDNYWLKCLVLNHNLFNDKYSKEKIREFIKRKIELACLGKILVHGNFQCIVVDGYAFMQSATRQKVTGLLKAREMYSQFWNNRRVTKIDTNRSPLTSFSEHYVVDLKNDEKMQKWFKYSYSGIIVNCHDEHTMRWAGSDYDYDIVYSTNDVNFINGKYPNQRVVTYNAKKPKKEVFRKEDGTFDRKSFDEKLFTTDTFSFGTKIGEITNTISAIVSMMPLFQEGSPERIRLEERVKAGCASQSRQIDKTKIGQNVKTLCTKCKQKSIIEETDTEEIKKEKEFLNSIVADKKPYFFRYKYSQTDKDYRDYIKMKNRKSINLFGKDWTLEKLLSTPEDELTEEQRTFIWYYYDGMPINDAPSVMNKICHYIEDIDFSIKQKVRTSDEFDYKMLQSENFSINKKIYEQVYETVTTNIKRWNDNKKILKDNTKLLDGFDKFSAYTTLKSELEAINPNDTIIANHLITLFYVDKPSLNKNILWENYGKVIYENIKNKSQTVYFPKKNPEGSLKFLEENYSIEKIDIVKNEEDNSIENNLEIYGKEEKEEYIYD